MFIWERATALAEAPVMNPGGVLLTGPLVFTVGTREQRARHLPAIRAAKVCWAQALGDVAARGAAVRARSRADGRLALDGYQASIAELEGATHLAGFASLVAAEEATTGPAPVAPTLFLARLDSPGVTRVGRATLKFDNVDGEMLGRPGAAQELIERVLALALQHPGATARAELLLARLDRALRETPNDRGGVLAEEAAFPRQVAALGAKFEALRALELRTLADPDAGAPPGAVAKALAVGSAELCAAAHGLLTQALGYYALPAPNEHLADNEAPLGGGYASPAIQGMLAGFSGYPATLDSLKDRLARQLFEGAGSGAGHTGN